jgi:hypothetical protein
MPSIARVLRAPYLAGILAITALAPQLCYAIHWVQLGRPTEGTPGLAYIDLDSVHVDGPYRVATFLTVYAGAAPNTHGIKLDRIAQETAFDCTHHTFSLISTIGYFEGKKAGSSSETGDWKTTFKTVPQDSFSQRTYDVTCNASVSDHPEDSAETSNSPPYVKLPPATDH